MTSLHYGRGMVSGYNSRDEICLLYSSTLGNGCMSDYLFKAVVYQEQLGGLAGSGLIGLAPNSQGTQAQLFVPSLYKPVSYTHLTLPTTPYV